MDYRFCYCYIIIFIYTHCILCLHNKHIKAGFFGNGFFDFRLEMGMEDFRFWIADCRLQIEDCRIVGLVIKFQISSNKSHTSSNFQSTKFKTYYLESEGLRLAKRLKEVTGVLNIGYWNFEFVWDL